MKASKYSAHFPLREPWWLRVNTSVSLYCWMGHLFLVLCRSNWVRLLDSCAGTDLDLCCQDREPFFFLTPLLPERCYVLTVSLFPAALQWQNTRWALTAHFAPAWQDPARFLCYRQGQRPRSVFVLRRTLAGSVQYGPTWKVNPELIVLCCRSSSQTPYIKHTHTHTSDVLQLDQPWIKAHV